MKLEYGLKEARELLQKEFQRRWRLVHAHDWINSATVGGNEFIRGFGSEVYKKAGRLQKKSLEEGDLNKLDITTIAQLLQTKYIKSSKDANFQDLQSAIQEIVEVRNKLAHHPTKSLSESEFINLWLKLSKAMRSLGFPEGELDSIRFADSMAGISFGHTNLRPVNEKSITEGTKLKESGNKLFRQNQFKDAIEMYSQGISLPDLPDDILAVLYSNRSGTYLKLEKTEKNIRNASDDAKRAVKAQPTWWKSHYRLGSAYEAKKKLSKALSEYTIALALDPTQVEVSSAISGCKNEIKIREREEHLDPNNMPMSREEYLKKINARFGGLGVTSQMLTEQMKVYRRSGNPELIAIADVYLAHHYLTGMDDVPQSYEQAARLFAKATAAGNAEAIYNLAVLTKSGKGVERNIPLALNLFKRAAAQPPFLDQGKTMKNVGVAEAEHSLGLCYEEGVGVEPNYQQAIDWYERGSAHGCGGSANNLGHMYSNGKGVVRNLKRAEQYWKLGNWELQWEMLMQWILS